MNIETKVPEDSPIPKVVGLVFMGMILGGILVLGLVPNGTFITQQMAFDILEQRCESGKAWEYSTPNPDTAEALLVVQCNPSS